MLLLRSGIVFRSSSVVPICRSLSSSSSSSSSSSTSSSPSSPSSSTSASARSAAGNKKRTTTTMTTATMTTTKKIPVSSLPSPSSLMPSSPKTAAATRTPTATATKMTMKQNGPPSPRRLPEGPPPFSTPPRVVSPQRTLNQTASQNRSQYASQNARQNASQQGSQNAKQNASQQGSQNRSQYVRQNASQQGSQNMSQQGSRQNGNQYARNNVSQNANMGNQTKPPQFFRPPSAPATTTTPKTTPRTTPAAAAASAPRHPPSAPPKSYPKIPINDLADLFDNNATEDKDGNERRWDNAAGRKQGGQKSGARSPRRVDTAWAENPKSHAAARETKFRSEKGRGEREEEEEEGRGGGEGGSRRPRRRFASAEVDDLPEEEEEDTESRGSLVDSDQETAGGSGEKTPQMISWFTTRTMTVEKGHPYHAARSEYLRYLKNLWKKQYNINNPLLDQQPFWNDSIARIWQMYDRRLRDASERTTPSYWDVFRTKDPYAEAVRSPRAASSSSSKNWSDQVDDLLSERFGTSGDGEVEYVDKEQAEIERHKKNIFTFEVGDFAQEDKEFWRTFEMLPTPDNEEENLMLLRSRRLVGKEMNEILNSLPADSDERAVLQKMVLALQSNAFIPSDERVQMMRRVRDDFAKYRREHGSILKSDRPVEQEDDGGAAFDLEAARARDFDPDVDADGDLSFEVQVPNTTTNNNKTNPTSS